MGKLLSISSDGSNGVAVLVLDVEGDGEDGGTMIGESLPEEDPGVFALERASSVSSCADGVGALVGWEGGHTNISGTGEDLADEEQSA